MDFKDRIKCEPKKTEKEEQVDAYIEYISRQGENFVEFVKTLNDCINIAEKYELIGEVGIKARIKDFDSSRRNTDNKALDDVFGIELIPKTERDKEWIMLLTQLTFNIGKNKAFDKPNGYKAYNQMISLKESEDDYDFSKIGDIVRETKVKTRISNNSNEDVITDKYPELKAQIIMEQDALNLSELENNALFEIMKKLNEFRSKIKFFKTCNYMPIIEMQIKTADVAEKAIRGSARHSKYKTKGNDENDTKNLEEDDKQENDFRDRIKNLYNNGYIKRGINAPIKLERIAGKIKLQNFEQTLLEMYPFLKDDIVRDRISVEKRKTKEYNRQVSYLITIYPFLGEVTNINIPQNCSAEEIKTRLKLSFMNTDLLGRESKQLN